MIYSPLSLDDVADIAERITRRQAQFDETLGWSVGIVLMNYGDKYVTVDCTGGEWDGTKGDLAPTDSLPKCPNGHPLLETSTAPSLALVYPETP